LICADLLCPYFHSTKGFNMTLKLTQAAAAAVIGLAALAPQAQAATATYNVTTTWLEPETAPRNSIFIGTFTYDDVTHAVTNLQGVLSESMSGDAIAYNPATGPRGTDNMNWVPLTNQLANGDAAHTYTWHDATLGGTFATVFKNTDSLTFWTGDGGDGWSPQSGVDVGGVYANWPKKMATFNPQNAYAMIFVPDTLSTANTTANPLALAWDEDTGAGSLGLAHTAYADFLNLVGPGGYDAGGMMGAVGMTATSARVYGSVGTMSGVPYAQVITASVPEPGTNALLLAGLGIVGLAVRRRQSK
jgi:PEP-CTERM motif